MNKEAIVRLENALLKHNDDCLLCALKDTRITEALEFMKQQPPAGEWTKKIRDFIKLYENELPKRAEITFLEEACVIIDRAEASNKDLVTACEYTENLLSKGIGQHTHALALIEAAIAHKE
jgi:hypothetical protein